MRQHGIFHAECHVICLKWHLSNYLKPARDLKYILNHEILLKCLFLFGPVHMSFMLLLKVIISTIFYESAIRLAKLKIYFRSRSPPKQTLGQILNSAPSRGVFAPICWIVLTTMKAVYWLKTLELFQISESETSNASVLENFLSLQLTVKMKGCIFCSWEE